MAVKRMLPDTYYELVEQFPLIHIRDDVHLASARGVIDLLLQGDLDEGEEAYLDALTDLVEVYEDEHVPIPDVSEADILRELIRSSGLSQRAFSERVGIAQSTISAVLNGARSLTEGQMIKIGRFFRIDPAAFLPAWSR